MYLENNTFREDMEYIAGADFVPWERLAGKRVLVTGATGLVGFNVVSGLLYASRVKSLGLTVLALVRDEARARERFAGQMAGYDDLQLVIGTVEELPPIAGAVDYIIHGASQTASRAFVQQPVETIHTAVRGTGALLELARAKGTQGLVYLSSMEAYGHPERGHRVTEDEIGAMTPLDVRNSYPISKQLCESLCCAYAAEYQVPAMIARLTQTFGPGANYTDGRIFAYFARCVREKSPIVLKTRGETERCYLYTADAVTAILAILLRGEPGQAYNAADERTYCSIAEMAERVAAWAGIEVQYDIEDEAANGYPTTLYMNLDTSRLAALGWASTRGGQSFNYMRE